MNTTRLLSVASLAALAVLLGARETNGQEPPVSKEVARLIRVLEDREVFHHDRVEAAETLGRIGPEAKEAVPALARALHEDDLEVRLASAEALGQIGPGVVDARSALEAAVRNDPSFEVQGAAAYALRQIGRPSLRTWVADHPKTSIGIAVYVAFLLFWLLLLWLRPLWLLRINESLKPYADFKFPSWLGGMTIPLRWVALVGFFHYHPRVLDAWVAKNLSSVRQGFLRRDTVKDRKVHVDLPVQLEGKRLPSFKPEHLRKSFGRRTCLLIWGEGGSGKTSLACQIARWGMEDDESERLTSHRMLPVLIEQELDFEVEEGARPLTEAIRGQLESLTGSSTPIPKDLLERLLRKRRILVIVDGFSEMTKQTQEEIRPELPGFSAHSLIVTSRQREELGGVIKTAVQPMRVKGNQLSAFMDAYLSHRGKRDLFEDAEYFRACEQLSLMVGERTATVLLAKLFAEQMIASKELPESPNLPKTIPDLMLSYLNELNRRVTEERLEDPAVHDAAKRIAWECLEDTFRPGAAPLERVQEALGGEADGLVQYLEKRLRVVQTVGPARDRVRFALDPLAEYLAAMYFVASVAGSEERWRNFFEKADQVEGSPETIREFLLAVRDTCLAQGQAVGVPESVVGELANRCGFDEATLGRIRIEQRVRRLAQSLKVPDREDRNVAAEALGKIGREAKEAVPALIEALRKDESSGVRNQAAVALGRIGREAKETVPALIEALRKDKWYGVRNQAAVALGGIGREAEGAVPALIEALRKTESGAVRAGAAAALGRIGPEAKEAVPAH